VERKPALTFRAVPLHSFFFTGELDGRQSALLSLAIRVELVQPLTFVTNDECVLPQELRETNAETELAQAESADSSRPSDIIRLDARKFRAAFQTISGRGSRLRPKNRARLLDGGFVLALQFAEPVLDTVHRGLVQTPLRFLGSFVALPG